MERYTSKNANNKPRSSLERVHQERLLFIENMNKELIAIEHEIKKDCIPAFKFALLS